MKRFVPTGRPPRLTRLATAIALSLAVPAMALTALPGRVQAAQTQRYDIPAGPLNQALHAFSSISGVLIAADGELTRGKHSPGLKGAYEPVQALAALLAGTGVQFRHQGNVASLYQASADARADSHVSQLAPVLVEGRTEDEKKKDDVYQKNVTNLYVDRNDLQRFKITNPGDVFRGVNGVYSMDSRSSPAITPNIRGLSGEGRVPLTIDGTEQSTNVWLHMYGAGNRSYADPSLFRSIEVEKGPSLSRGIKSGVGGAVNIRTIEAGDIIPDGDSFGIEVKLESSGNTSKPRWNPNDYFGQDYRDIPGAYIMSADNAIGVPLPPPRQKSGKEIFNFKDHAEMVAIAGRHRHVDVLLSYSERSKGNYYAGKQGADRYRNNPYFRDQPGGESTDTHYPNLAKAYYPGDEVFSTTSKSRTLLLKNNWHLPQGQKLGFQFMRTNIEFGETTPGESLMVLGYRESFEKAYGFNTQVVYENARSKLQIDSYKLSYDIKPEGARWLN